MRHATGGAGSREEPEATSRLDGDGGVEGMRSAPSAVKLVLVFVGCVSTLYTTLDVVGKVLAHGGTHHQQNQRETSRKLNVVLGLEEGNGERENLRSTYRELSLMGFEEDNGQGGEWLTCRAYQDDELSPHKTVR